MAHLRSVSQYAPQLKSHWPCWLHSHTSTDYPSADDHRSLKIEVRNLNTGEIKS
jgi:hypothetical protein